MFQKGKTKQLKNAPGISGNIQYFYAKNYFYGSKKMKAAYNSHTHKITWKDGSSDIVTEIKKYASTVFFAIKSGYQKKG